MVGAAAGGVRAHGVAAGQLFLGCGLDFGGLVRERQAFRSFRLDRIQSMTGLTETFKLSDGQRLMDYLRQQGVDPQALAEGR